MNDGVLIVEDHPLYRDALSRLLGRFFPPDRVFAVSSAEEAVELARSTPDVRLVMLDMALPGVRGVEAVAVLARALPQAAFIAVSASDDRREVQGALRCGVAAFVSKSAPPDALVETIDRVLRGTADGPEWVACAAGTAAARVPGLTPRQRQILALLENGLSNKEIALRLGISETRVKQHVSAMFRSLGVSNRTQVVLAARELGMAAARENLPQPRAEASK